MPLYQFSVKKFRLNLLPCGWSEEYESGEYLKPADEHTKRKNSLAEIGVRCEVVYRADSTKTGADVAHTCDDSRNVRSKIEIIDRNENRPDKNYQKICADKAQRTFYDVIIDRFVFNSDNIDGIGMDNLADLPANRF